MLAVCLQRYSLLGIYSSQTFKDLEAKRSITIHCFKATHPCTTSAHALTIVPFVFSVTAGLIVEMLFMLFSVYKTA